MASTYKFLTDNDLSPKAIWAWAKKLVHDLNERDAKLSSSASGVPVGSSMYWFEAAAPLGWVLADGGQYSRTDKPALFNVYGYRYGGSDEFFNVPDFRNRLLMGAGTLVALNTEAGADTVTLTTNELPSHAHEVNDPEHTHAFAGTPHSHTINDPQHHHTINDPQHHHAGGAAASTTNTAGAGADISAANTADAATGITINDAATGITINDATAAGTNADAETGISVRATGGGQAFSVLNPVFGVNVIIKY